MVQLSGTSSLTGQTRVQLSGTSSLTGRTMVQLSGTSSPTGQTNELHGVLFPQPRFSPSLQAFLQSVLLLETTASQMLPHQNI